MSITTLPVPTDSQQSVDAPRTRLTTSRVVRAEWIKMRSLRSTWIMLAAVFAAIVVFGLLAAAVASGGVSTQAGGPAFAQSTDPVSTVLSGANFAVLLVSVLGVLVGAREYSSGLIRVTLAAVPSRYPVLIGKLAVFTALVTPAVLLGVLVAFLGGTAILDAGGVASATLSDPGVLGSVLGTAGYMVGLGIMGVALGVLLRGVAAGLGTLLGGILFVPTLATALLPDSWDSVLKYLPSNAGQAFSSTIESSSLLDAGTGVVVFGLWVVAALGGAAWTFMRRDA